MIIAGSRTYYLLVSPALHTDERQTLWLLRVLPMLVLLVSNVDWLLSGRILERVQIKNIP